MLAKVDWIGPEEPSDTPPERNKGRSVTFGALLLLVVAIGALVMLAHVGDQGLRAESEHDCLRIDDGSRRLACYDGLAHKPATQPFKGANVPLDS